MRKSLVSAILVVATAIPLSGGVAQAAPKSTLSLVPIKAFFEGPLFSTDYFADYIDTAREPVTIKWTIKLKLVDKAGTPDPSSPGSGAAVDVGCSNAGIGVSAPLIHLRGSNANFPSADFITWYHPDPANSTPTGRFHCNHLDEGPHGHQGLITVVVADTNWVCTATYRGTNSSLHAIRNEVNPNVRNGTASEPTCSRIR